MYFFLYQTRLLRYIRVPFTTFSFRKVGVCEKLVCLEWNLESITTITRKKQCHKYGNKLADQKKKSGEITPRWSPKRKVLCSMALFIVSNQLFFQTKNSKKRSKTSKIVLTSNRKLLLNRALQQLKEVYSTSSGLQDFVKTL